MTLEDERLHLVERDPLAFADPALAHDDRYVLTNEPRADNTDAHPAAPSESGENLLMVTRNGVSTAAYRTKECDIRGIRGEVARVRPGVAGIPRLHHPDENALYTGLHESNYCMNTNRPQAELMDLSAYRRYLAALTLFHQAAADSVGLSGTDYQASNLLDLEGPLTSGELARRLGLSFAAASRLVDRLIKDGIARRRLDASDRRRVVVEHTGMLPGDLKGTLERVREPIATALASMTNEQLAGVVAYISAATDAYSESARALRDTL